MQEVVVSASPYSEWGYNYVIYQFFMGIGEAIVALVLCITIAKFTINEKNHGNYLRESKKNSKVLMVGLIALTFTVERIIAYKTGIVSSDIVTSPLPCYAWTILFGITLGCCYVILLPVFYEYKNPVNQSLKLVVITIGLSWIIFNSFIGWIIDGAMPPVLFRSVLDILVVFITALIGNKYIIKIKMLK